MEIRSGMPRSSEIRRPRLEPTPEPRDQAVLESLCTRAGDRIASLGPVRCGGLGLLLGLGLTLASGQAECLILGPLGAWMGYDARQGQQAFLAGPDSKLWQKREAQDGIGTSRQGASFLGTAVSAAAGTAGWLLTGSQLGGMLASGITFFATQKALERAGRSAEQRLIQSPYQS